MNVWGCQGESDQKRGNYMEKLVRGRREWQEEPDPEWRNYMKELVCKCRGCQRECHQNGDYMKKMGRQRRGHICTSLYTCVHSGTYFHILIHVGTICGYILLYICIYCQKFSTYLYMFVHLCTQ